MEGAHVVTFLLTDVEGSTRIWETRPAEAGALIGRHEEIIGETVVRHGGEHLKRRGEGDSTFNVFDSAGAAITAALDMQRGLGAEPWPEGASVRVRAALHTGDAEYIAGDYQGTSVNRCARLRSIGHGGQVLLSAATAELVRDHLPAGAGLRTLGAHRLKDLARPETVFQLEHPDLAADFPPLRSLEPELHNLPAQRTPMVGRREFLDRIGRLLEETRLLTLTGVGGCGKTRLSIEAAKQAMTRFPDGVLFVDLAAISDSALVWTALAGAVSSVAGGFGGSSRPVREDLLAFLEGQKTLILLDNCEHLIDACAELAEGVLDRCAAVKILATSREALGIEGEQALVVPSLGLPEGDNPQESESVKLFAARAAAANAEFRLSTDNLPAVSEICRRLDGIPLAIELAAARVAHLSPEQIADRLEERFRLLTGTRRRVQRQQTLQATMDWSYDLLPETERILLRRLAVFPGSFDLAAVEAVCMMGPETEALLGALVSRSLVGVTEESGRIRYRLLETVRIYAESLLDVAKETETYRTGHRDHYMDRVNALPLVSFWGVGPEAMAMNGEIDNLRGVLEWSGLDGHYDQIGRILLRAQTAWNWTGGQDEAKRWLALAQEHQAELDPEQRLVLLAASDTAALTRLDPGAVQPWARGAEWGISTVGNCCIVIGLYVESEFTAVVGNPAASIELATYGLDNAARDLPAVWSAVMLLTLGTGLFASGDLRGALDAYRQATDRSGELEFPAWWAAWQQALALHLLGEPQLALDAARRAQDHPARMSLAGMGDVINRCALALAMAANGEPDAAEDMLAVVIETMRRTTVPAMFELCVGMMGCVAAIRGEFERASLLLAAGPMLRTPSTLAFYRHYLRVVRDHLDGESARNLRALGSAMSRGETVAYALRRT